MHNLTLPIPQSICIRNKRPRIRPVRDNNMIESFLKSGPHVRRVARHRCCPFHRPSFVMTTTFRRMPYSSDHPVQSDVICIAGCVPLLVLVDYFVGWIFRCAFWVGVRSIRHDILNSSKLAQAPTWKEMLHTYSRCVCSDARIHWSWRRCWSTGSFQVRQCDGMAIRSKGYPAWRGRRIEIPVHSILIRMRL
jgi:hypothetical protein